MSACGWLRWVALALAGCAAAPPADVGSAPASAQVGSSEHGVGHGPHHGHHGEMPHRFEDAAKWAKVFDDPARDAWQRPDDVVAALKLGAGMTVADLGAGTGYFLPRLSQAVGPAGQVLGLDV